VVTVIALPFVALSLRAAGQAGSAAAPEPVTFTKDIAPILQRSCQNCHRPGSVAPMSLLTYEEVRPWARSMKARTGRRDKPDVMPPWYIEKNIGIQRYKEDMSLNDAEVATIARWVDAGAPRGNPGDMPPPRQFADAGAWQIGTPDLIVTSPSFEMPPTAPDWWGPLGDKPVPSGLTEDRYVAAVEVKEITELSVPERESSGRQTIGGQAIFHHIGWTAVDSKGEPFPGESVGGGEAGTSWPTHEVGRNADIFDPAAGKLLRAGSQLTFSGIHVHANGKRTKAHVNVGFKFHPKGYRPTKNVLWPLNIYNTGLDVAGLEGNQKAEGFFVLPQNAKLIVFEPHMHAAGVRMCLDAIWENTAETLTCSGYNHSWVRAYTYEDDAAPLLPKGTILRGTGYFDSTPANKNVADPRNWTGLGHRSMDNMSITILGAMYLTDEEFAKEMAKRREALELADGQTVIGCPLCGYVNGYLKMLKKPATAAAQQQ
jgi:hypothetical protein